MIKSLPRILGALLLFGLARICGAQPGGDQGRPVDPEATCTPVPVASLIGPANGATNVAKTVTLQWARNCAYNVNVTLTGGGDTIKVIGVSNSWDPPGQLKPATTYTWSVEFQEPFRCECGAGSVIPTWTFTTSAGGTPTPTPTPIPQAPVRKFTSPNPTSPGFFGRSISSIPDTNDDGTADIIVGADLEGDERRAYIYSGADGALLRTLISANPAGPSSGNFAKSLVGVADVTGDGRGDVLIGDPDNDELGFGRAYLYNGATGAYISTLTPGLSDGYGFFGASVASLPDFTGDGKPDLAVGLYRGPQGQGWAPGRVYLYSGFGGGITSVDSPNPTSEGDFGFSIAGIGDVSFDSLGDLIVGAPNEKTGGSGGPRTGHAYVFSPSISSVVYQLDSAFGKDGGQFGYSVASIADLNGDSTPDVIVGAPSEDSSFGIPGAGRIYIYSGASGNAIAQLSSPESAAGELFGYSVAGMPDFNGNGKPDLLVGAPGAVAPGASVLSGVAYIIDGSTFELIAKLNPSNPQNFSYFGAAVAGSPDLNGDSLGEGLIASRGEDIGTTLIYTNAGAAYVALSGTFTPAPTPTPTKSPTPTSSPSPTPTRSPSPTATAGATPTSSPGRATGDFDNSGCVDLADFLILLDGWQLPFEGGDILALGDFLNLVDNWLTGPSC